MLQSRWVGVLVAVAGVCVCVAALIGFLLGVVQSTLPWQPEQSLRDYYLAIGESYTQGFTVGFFLCFFLILIVVSALPRVAFQSRQRIGADEQRPRRHVA